MTQRERAIALVAVKERRDSDYPRFLSIIASAVNGTSDEVDRVLKALVDRSILDVRTTPARNVGEHLQENGPAQIWYKKGQLWQD